MERLWKKGPHEAVKWCRKKFFTCAALACKHIQFHLVIVVVGRSVPVPCRQKPRTAFDHSATCNVQAHAGAVVAFLRLIASVVIQYSLIILIIHLQMPTCKSKLSTAVSHRNACRTYQDKADALCRPAWQPQSKNKLHYIDYQYDMIRNHTYFLPRIEEGTKRQN